MSRTVYYSSPSDTPETFRVLDVNEAAVIEADGRALFVQDDTLFAQMLHQARAVSP